MSKNRFGRQRCPKGRHHQNKVTRLGTLWRSVFILFRVFYAKKCVPDTRRFFPQLLGCTERSCRWAHMQSVHVYAVQTNFSLFAFFLRIVPWRVQHGPIWAQFLCQNVMFVCKQRLQKILQKRCSAKVKQQSIYRPGGSRRANLAYCTDKKQLFEQQLKHCSRFLKKKGDWAQNWCRKTDRIAESLQNT